MKITKRQLRRIIKEEISRLNEGDILDQVKLMLGTYLSEMDEYDDLEDWIQNSSTSGGFPLALEYIDTLEYEDKQELTYDATSYGVDELQLIRR